MDWGQECPQRGAGRGPAQIPAEPKGTVTRTALTSLRLRLPLKNQAARAAGAEGKPQDVGWVVLPGLSFPPPGAHDLRP